MYARLRTGSDAMWFVSDAIWFAIWFAFSRSIHVMEDGLVSVLPFFHRVDTEDVKRARYSTSS